MGESTLESSMGEVGDFNGDHAGSAEPAKTFVLEANQELRFEVPFGKVALLKVRFSLKSNTQSDASMKLS